jgi:hypothetical protein
VDYDIYAQRLDSNGVVLWNNTGNPISIANGNQSAVDVLSTTQTNGLICTWRDGRSGNYDIYAQKISPAGNALWGANGLLVATSPFNQINPNICSDGNDGCIITWQDSTFNDWDVYAQKINGSGQIQWSTNGEAVSNAIEIQGHPKHIPDGNGGAIFAWQDKRANQYDIYVHHLFTNGSPVKIESDKSLLDWTVFPNPSNGYLNIEVRNGISAQLVVSNIHGQVMGDWKVAERWEYNGESWPAGIYVIRDQTSGQTLRWIKE